MLLPSKEASNKDEQLKTQMLASFEDDGSKNGENVWLESGFFDDHQSGLTIPKANFPENTLCYVNQVTVLFVKGGEKAIYLEFLVVGQVIPVANADPSINLETHVFKDDEVLLYVPVYNKATGLYGGLKKKLGQITLGGNDQEHFFLWVLKRKRYPVVLLYEATFAEYFSLYRL